MLSYPVGALLFGALAREMGDAALDATVAAFYREHRATGATLDDLIRHLRAGGAPEETLVAWIETTDGLRRSLGTEAAS
jgi:hypothetical protein